MKPRPLNAAIRGALRRLFSRSDGVRACLRSVRRQVPRHNKDGSRAKVDSVQYLCAVCGVWHGSTHVEVDHVVPVICPDSGFVDWNVFVDRLFCDPSNLQVICDTCHDAKTLRERAIKLNIAYTPEVEALAAAGAVADSRRDVAKIRSRLKKYAKPGPAFDIIRPKAEAAIAALPVI